MPDGLYERDILVWAEEQADLLRRLWRGERLNAAIDWPNLIEEVGDVGLSELRAVRSLLRQAIVHLLKLRFDPGDASLHWRGEIIGFLTDARDRFTPSMPQRIDLDDLFVTAVKQVREAGLMEPGLFDGKPCPIELHDLLARDVDIDRLLARLA
jgi:hypothetical protein